MNDRTIAELDDEIGEVLDLLEIRIELLEQEKSVLRPMICRDEIQTALKLSAKDANYIANKMISEGYLVPVGPGRLGILRVTRRILSGHKGTDLHFEITQQNLVRSYLAYLQWINRPNPVFVTSELINEVSLSDSEHAWKTIVVNLKKQGVIRDGEKAERIPSKTHRGFKPFEVLNIYEDFLTRIAVGSQAILLSRQGNVDPKEVAERMAVPLRTQLVGNEMDQAIDRLKLSGTMRVVESKPKKAKEPDLLEKVNEIVSDVVSEPYSEDEDQWEDDDVEHDVHIAEMPDHPIHPHVIAAEQRLEREMNEAASSLGADPVWLQKLSMADLAHLQGCIASIMLAKHRVEVAELDTSPSAVPVPVAPAPSPTVHEPPTETEKPRAPEISELTDDQLMAELDRRMALQ